MSTEARIVLALGCGILLGVLSFESAVAAGRSGSWTVCWGGVLGFLVILAAVLL